MLLSVPNNRSDTLAQPNPFYDLLTQIALIGVYVISVMAAEQSKPHTCTADPAFPCGVGTPQIRMYTRTASIIAPTHVGEARNHTNAHALQQSSHQRALARWCKNKTKQQRIPHTQQHTMTRHRARNTQCDTT